MSDATLPSYKREEIIWDSPLTKDEKYTLLALNTFVDGNGECWPGNRRLSKMMSVPVSTMKRYIASLEEKGVVTRKRRYRKDGGETSSGKRVDFDAIAALTPSPPVSHPQPVDEPGGQPVDEPPPSPPVSHQELSNRTIQKESSHSRTTTSIAKKRRKSGSSSEREDASLLKGEALPEDGIEKAEWVVNSNPALSSYGVEVTENLVRLCDGKDHWDLGIAVMALVQCEESGKLRDAQRYLEDAIAKGWLPSRYWVTHCSSIAGYNLSQEILNYIDMKRPVEGFAVSA